MWNYKCYLSSLPLLAGGATLLAGCGSGVDPEPTASPLQLPAAVAPAGEATVAIQPAAGQPSTAGQPSAAGQPFADPVVCEQSVPLTGITAFDDGSNDGNGPENVVDGVVSSDSRWSSEGPGKWLALDLGQTQQVREVFTAWLNADDREAFYDVEASLDGQSWRVIAARRSSQGAEELEPATVEGTEARYIRIVGGGNSENGWNSLMEVEVHVCSATDDVVQPNQPVVEDAQGMVEPAQGMVEEGQGGAEPSEPQPPQDEPPAPTSEPGNLDPGLPPSGNFDLTHWNISIPVDEDDNDKADSVSTESLSRGFEHDEYVYTGADGGLVFRCAVDGYKTSKNTKFTRSELREMLRGLNDDIRTQGVNENNWVFSSAPRRDREAAGGVDGTLTARLAVNHVTTTGSDSHVGRVIIGQIHANDDEPVRLYYRKLPGNARGSIYFAHEPRDGFGSERLISIIGSPDNEARNPSDGIELDEKFGYEIDVEGNTLTVTIVRSSGERVSKRHDMSKSGFDEGGQYMYFKAGVYNQNNSGRDNDYVQATFYEIETSHN